MIATKYTWFKSSYSGTDGDSCVEVAITSPAVHVRDTKDTARAPFSVTREAWARFVGYAAGG